MLKLGITLGTVKLVKLSAIENIEAIIQFEIERRAGEPANRAILRTQSVHYSETAIIQSGHEIVGADVRGGSMDPIDVLLKHYERIRFTTPTEHDTLLAQYGFGRSDVMWIDFDVFLDVQPLPAGAAARALLGGA
jgi:hypothetical protein